MTENSEIDWPAMTSRIADWSRDLGFGAIGITDIDLEDYRENLHGWLDRGYQGEMTYMSRHGEMRTRPDLLHPGTCSIISVRMDYLTPSPPAARVLANPELAYVSRYALGRDYHKTVRRRLARLAALIGEYLQGLGYHDYNARVFTDSAPLLEKPLAEKAGIGWVGKHTLVLSETAGSWFFLGEILTNLPLPPLGEPARNRCGSCTACIDICPTDAIVAPYQLDARRCISYLTIEHRGVIDESLRRAMGNRVFGCDDCQLVCPWNRYAKITGEQDFAARHGLDTSRLTALFGWTESEFMARTEGSAIRRTGYPGWLRNLAIGLGNAPFSPDTVKALMARKGHSDLVDEHIAWALDEQASREATGSDVSPS